MENISNKVVEVARLVIIHALPAQQNQALTVSLVVVEDIYKTANANNAIVRA